MSKLLATLVAALFAASTMIAFAADDKMAAPASSDTKATTNMSKSDAKKPAATKKKKAKKPKAMSMKKDDMSMKKDDSKAATPAPAPSK